jgi:hypothetical protein
MWGYSTFAWTKSLKYQYTPFVIQAKPQNDRQIAHSFPFFFFIFIYQSSLP